jgi:hypothetical protein
MFCGSVMGRSTSFDRVAGAFVVVDCLRNDASLFVADAWCIGVLVGAFHVGGRRIFGHLD